MVLIAAIERKFMIRKNVALLLSASCTDAARRLLCCCALSFLSITADAQNVGSVEASVRRLAAAMERHDAARLIEMLVPEAVDEMKKALGSQEHEALVKYLAELYAGGEKMGIQTSVKLGPASEVGRTQERLFLFIPYLVSNSIAGREPIIGRSFFVAVSKDEGATWRFFEGAGLASHLGKTLLPSYAGSPPVPVPLPMRAYR